MQLWGLKTISALDVWSIEHVLTGITIGSLVAWSSRLDKPSDHTLVQRLELYKLLFIAYLWECIEHYLEEGLAGYAVAQWFQGVEHWSNRLITDPLCVLLGYMLYKRYTWLRVPARIFSCLWLIVHIFVFPHSMYLHT